MEIVQQADPRNTAEIVQPAQQKLRHERLRMWEWTARPRSQDMEGTVPRNAGFENRTFSGRSQWHRGKNNTPQRRKHDTYSPRYHTTFRPSSRTSTRRL